MIVIVNTAIYSALKNGARLYFVAGTTAQPYPATHNVFRWYHGATEIEAWIPAVVGGARKPVANWCRELQNAGFTILWAEERDTKLVCR